MPEPVHQKSTSPDHRPRARWWPALLVLASAGLATFYFLVIREDSQQWRNLDAMVTCIVAVLLLQLWVLFLSRLRWKVRLLVSGSVVGLIGLAVAIFRIQGVTGDLLPIFRFRWSRPSSSTLSPPIAKTVSASEPAAPDAAISPGNEFPQFLGPHRNAMLPDGPALARDWKAHPPVKLWRQPIGAGWSGFAIAGDRAVTQEQRGEEELVACYDLLTGRLLWSHADTARYFTTLAGEGPRATPAVSGNRVVTLGSTGILNCLDLDTGRGIWSRNIITDNSSRVPEWGVAGSPLVLNGLVIVNPGGKDGRSLVAYRLSDGAFVWGGGDDRASYSSPCAATINGVRQILIFNQHAIFGHAAADGKVLWQHPWDPHQPHVALPVVLDGDRVFVSSGYGIGSELLKIIRDSSGKFSAARLWKTNRLKSKFNNVVVRNGYVYGLDDGILCCLDLATGGLKWKDGRYGHGQFLLVRDTLLITAENGDVVLIDPVPTERRELTKFRALDGKTWNPPALVGDLLLLRNDQEAACYKLPAKR